VTLIDVKSRYDEEKSLREDADQRLVYLSQELQRERQDKDRLHTELVTNRDGVYTVRHTYIKA
jgi:hypothetical protein